MRGLIQRAPEPPTHLKAGSDMIQFAGSSIGRSLAPPPSPGPDVSVEGSTETSHISSMFSLFEGSKCSSYHLLSRTFPERSKGSH